MGFLLIVKLIGGVVVAVGQDQFVARFHDLSAEPRLRTRVLSILIVWHLLLLSAGVARGIGTPRNRSLVRKKQSDSQRREWQHTLEQANCLFFMESPLTMDWSSDAKVQVRCQVRRYSQVVDIALTPRGVSDLAQCKD